MFAMRTKRTLLYSLLGILLIHPALAADSDHNGAGTPHEKVSQTPRPGAPETEIPLPKTPAELVDSSSSGTTEKTLADAIEKLSSAKTEANRDQAAKELVTLLGPIALKLFVKKGKVDVDALAKVLRLDPEAENGREAIAALKDALKDFDPDKTDSPSTTEQQGQGSQFDDPGNVPSFDVSGGFNGNPGNQGPFGDLRDPNNPNFNPALAQQLDPTNPNFNPALADQLDPNRRNRRNRNNDNTSTSTSNSSEDGDDNKGQQQTPPASSGGSPSGGGGKGDGVKPVEVPKPSAPPTFSAPQAGGEPTIDPGLAKILRGDDISDPNQYERIRGEVDDMVKQAYANGKAMIDGITQLAKGFVPKQLPTPGNSTQAGKWSKNGSGGGGGGFIGKQTGVKKGGKKPPKARRRRNQESNQRSAPQDLW